MDWQGLARTSSGLARTSNGLARTSNGLAGRTSKDLLLLVWVLSAVGITAMLFAWVFSWYLLKPMPILASPRTNLLKPMCIAAKN